jgi:opacity protein-like surface antigen
MKSTKVLIVALILALVSTAAWAQGKIEITPFVGYRTTGSISGGTAAYTEFHIEDGLAYGVGLGYRFSPLFTLEFQWSRVDSTVTAHGVTFQKTELGSIATDVYHANFMFFFRPEEYKLRPYFMFGLGATVANVGNVTVGDETLNPGAESRFSWSMGLGLQAQFREHIGLRLQTRWLPTYINSTSGWWYDWWGNVWLVPIANYMNQFEFSGGLTFRF